jgi:hypothetical protein
MHRIIFAKSVALTLTLVVLSCGNGDPGRKHSTGTATVAATDTVVDTAESTDAPPAASVHNRARQTDATATGIRFAREHIVATVQDNGQIVEINGRYEFANPNNTERMQRFYLPRQHLHLSCDQCAFLAEQSGRGRF